MGIVRVAVDAGTRRSQGRPFQVIVQYDIHKMHVRFGDIAQFAVHAPGWGNGSLGLLESANRGGGLAILRDVLCQEVQGKIQLVRRLPQGGETAAGGFHAPPVALNEAVHVTAGAEVLVDCNQLRIDTADVAVKAALVVAIAHSTQRKLVFDERNVEDPLDHGVVAAQGARVGIVGRELGAEGIEFGFDGN